MENPGGWGFGEPDICGKQQGGAETLRAGEGPRLLAHTPRLLLNRAGETGPARRGELADGGMADTESPGLQGAESTGDTRSGGCAAQHGQRGRETSGGPAQPGLGGVLDGLSDGMAGYRWPAGWWPTPKTGSNRNSRQAIIDEKGGGKHKSDLSLMQAVEVVSGILPKELKSPDELPPQWRQQWPAGPGEQHPWEPPRIATGVKDRVAKLKALGNAVVPAQAYPIFKAIAEIQEVGL